MTDPHPTPNRFVGKRVSFDHAGKRLVGTVEKQDYVGAKGKGAIPDYELTVIGGSGKRLVISMYETYATFD